MIAPLAVSLLAVAFLALPLFGGEAGRVGVRTELSSERRATSKYTISPRHTSELIDRFKVEFTLPTVEGSPRLAKAVYTAMEQLRVENLAALREDCANDDDAVNVACEGNEEWWFEIAIADDNLLSVRILFSRHMRGTAHPSHGARAFTWVVHTPKLLTLTDLTHDLPNFLKRISDICRASLRADKDLEQFTHGAWIDEGTPPTPDSFAVWTITERGLLITFPEYQVAAYVAGQPEVEIPLTKLNDLLNLNGLSRIC